MFSGWNYRIAFKIGSGMVERLYYICEVYYDEETHKPRAITKDKKAFGGSVEELKADLELMLRAFDKPVLNWETLEEE